MKDTDITNELKEEKWGYIRPGFYPIKSHSVVPAMVCLSDHSYAKEPNVEFILIKTDCYLKEWEDALKVSEQDYDQALSRCEENAHPTEKLERLLGSFTAKGYLLLNKVKAEFNTNHFH